MRVFDPGHWTFCLRFLALAVTSLASSPAIADDLVSVSHEVGFERILFTLSPETAVQATSSNGILTLSFARPVNVDRTALAASLSDFVATSRSDPDGRTYRFVLAQSVRIHSTTSANQVAIDLLPKNFDGTAPDLPPPRPPATTPAVDPLRFPILKIGLGTNQEFTRLVFPWARSVAYSVTPSAGKLQLRFAGEARPDLSAIERFAPPWVKNARWRFDGANIIVDFDIDAASGFHDFRSGSSIVVDVLAPKTDATASGAQPVAAATASPPVDARAGHAVDASGQLTRSGAVLTFEGAATRGSAVFMRGFTAWIVLQDAPPLESARLKAALGNFPVAMEASSGEGVSILRLSFAQPEQIGAHAEGGDLKVVIQPQVSASAIALGFARNQDAAGHAALSTLLPGATRALMLEDPIVGDEIILVPAAAGRAALAPHEYVEFSVLKSASGLVLVPKVEDLALSVDRTRVTIARNGGLSLTPSGLALAATPGSLATDAGGPSFLDFRRWQTYPAPTLAAVRRLRVASAGAGRDSDQARLRLARFYLANGFSAEALGLINLMQARDAALQSDRQLETMRAAANYLMGRYRDAYNDISGAAFSSDRHAAFWRGLIDVALENWREAAVECERAEPVLKHYPAEWRARLYLAKANAALAQDRLEIADAAVARMPPGLSHSRELDVALIRARLLAAERRGREAGAIFDNLEQASDQRIATEASYFRIEAALHAKVMRQSAAIEGLERLRFRWRGDLLELAILRKLASLYFAKQHWRDGLHILRIAAETFSEEDMARQAQDDMRAAFAALFIKDKAGRLAPIEALALFYDFIDLTPIGPDGDGMIRRMSERLVAVDLLGPAADLLHYQITKRLDGVARAQVAARLATIYLLDQRPQQALDALRTTQQSALPDDIAHQRLLLEARAFAALKQWDNALDLIEVDGAPDTARLRADIYWESGNWPVAGHLAEETLAGRGSDTEVLTTGEREEVMRAAIAYSLANDETSLERLRQHFSAKMQASRDANAFDVVSQRIDNHGIAFRDTAARIAAIDTLQAFMKDFRRNYAAAHAAN